MQEGNYSKYCGKKNEGIKRIQFANSLAEKMTNETTSKRDGKSVLSKIQHIERSWRQAHNFASSETGAGIMEQDGKAHFKDLVTQRCPWYYDLLDVMADRASSEPTCTSYEANEDDDDKDIDGDDRVSGGGLSELSEDEEEDKKQGGGGASVNTKRTAATSSSCKSSTKKQKTSTLMDESAIEALTAGNKAMEQKMMEQVRHNKVVEAVEKRRVALEEKREEREAL
jgi:hypothetical protein